jgi:hypothetical protein
MPVPKRPSTYILGLLLVLLAVLAWWITRTTEVLTEARMAKPISATTPTITPPPSTAPRSSTGPPTLAIDPANQSLADELHSSSSSAERDLEIVDHFLDLIRRTTGGNPVGLNSDITDVLTGGGDPQRPRVFPGNHAAIIGGQLTDRWGTPYWFHPNSSFQMEIRSAGPDKELFTGDDVVKNPSPAGLGATPAETSSAP